MPTPPRLTLFPYTTLFRSTADGTGVRDYIHVVDLAQGHVAALQYLAKEQGVHTWNLGTGQGYSVLQMITAFEQASAQKVPYRSEEHTSELQSRPHLVCRLLLEK